MSGFPNRPTRLALGPLQPYNRKPTIAPDKELDANVAKLLLWQVAGLGLSGPRAWAMVTFTGPTTYTVTAWGAGWRPDDQGSVSTAAKPSIGRTSAGVLTAQYPATIPDQDGIAQTTQLFGADALPQGLTFMRKAQQVNADGRTVDIRIWDAAGAAADSSFLLSVW
jgi:hypothetical protein